MEEIGKVIETKGEMAVVEIQRHSACHNCDKECGLAGEEHEHEVDDLIVEVDNQIGAQPGQRVQFEMTGRSIVSAALLVYLFPLVSIVVGYFLGDYFMAQIAENSGAIGAIGFLILSIIIIRIVSNETNIKPRITDIIK
ncbi:hypothetical protein JCM16358_21890 [Halanaerocella petrolearia]